jgi:cytochrome P450
MEQNQVTTGTVPPSPKGYPVIGVLPQLLRSPLQYATKMLRSYGDCVCLDLGFGKVYLLGHPDHAQHVLRDNRDNYDKGEMYRPLRRVLGAGVGTTEGDIWRQKRRTLQPMFGRQRLANLTAPIITAIGDTLKRWPSKPRHERFDLTRAIDGMSMRIGLRTLFNTNLPEPEMERLIAAIQTIIDQIGINIWTSFLPSWVPIPGDARFQQAIQTVEATIYRLIAQRRQSGSQQADDLLGLLLQAQDAETGQALNDLQVRDEAVSFFIAGYETTARALAWTFFLLCRHPDIERTLRAELDSVLGGRTPAEEDLAQLSYTKMVFQESMRLYPPVWLILRQAKQDDAIGGYRIPANSAVVVLSYGIQHHAAFWEEPEAFRPERFAPDKSDGRHRYAYLPFGAGPRQCIGSGLAMAEGPLVLAMVAQRYRMRLVPGHPVEPKAAFMLSPRKGILVDLESA